jgi:hypothetical protein
MERAIAMAPDSYYLLQKAVAETAKLIYIESLHNLKTLL